MRDLLAVCAATLCTSAIAQVDPLSGIDFVTITHAGNAPWAGDGTLDDRAVGRGGVNYEYRIGRFEVTTAQWAEFFNAAKDRPAGDSIPFVTAPTFWGAQGTAPMNPGAQRWTVPAGQEMWPVGNITWRTAAIYANWLHNGKATNREAFLNGAYDVSTFGYNGNIFTDQAAHHPDARYWIPTWDELLKATHFDPDRFGDDQPGWWTGPYSFDGIPAGGPPDQGFQANWREFPGWNAVPLGSYPFTTPWGLYDASGATGEWTESVLQFFPDTEKYRIFDGSFWNSNSSGVADLIYRRGGEFPSIPTWQFGLRIAAQVPSPGGCVMALGFSMLAMARRRRSHAQTSVRACNGGGDGVRAYGHGFDHR